MPREIPVGNGSLLVAFDPQYRLADFYFPHVGMENHAAARFRFGVWADGVLQWIERSQWQKSLMYLRDTLATDVLCENDELGLKLRCHDAVDSDANVYIRKIAVRNARPEARKIKIFLHHDLHLYGTPIGDTAMFDPRTRSVIHYKARRYILINAQSSGEPGIVEYACGRSGIGGADGSWRDAEDGVLSMTPIAQGSVDSIIGVPIELEPNGSATLFYWICTGKTYDEVRQLDAHVREETAARMIARTASYWYSWANKPPDDLSELSDELVDLYKRSLLIMRTHCDNGGAVVAANDSDIQWGHNDHYSYVWTRDAAFVCDAFDRAGFPEITRRFLQFAQKVIKDEGYFLHKYHPDGSVASLWHPWVRKGTPQLPIQEDETALVIWLLARHYERTRDLELLRTLYERLVVNPAEFLAGYRDPETGLPSPSFDLWEERQGVFTFTCCAVFAGLTAAAQIAALLSDQERRDRWAAAASEIREAMTRHLWLEDEGRFARGLVLRDDDRLELDRTVDASTFAVFYLDVFPATSATVAGTMDAIRERLWVQSEVGGVARYEGDAYQRISEETSRVPGNPWLICTLWLAEYAIRKAKSVAELQSALDLVRWARSKAPASLVLAEQIDPYDGQPLSVAPLTWSHAQIVSVIRSYLEALRKIRAASSETPIGDEVRIDESNPVDKQ